MEREKRKLEFKKTQILEKYNKSQKRLQAERLEKEILDKCKIEAKTKAMVSKESRLNAI